MVTTTKGKKPKKLADKQGMTATEEVLNAILPPREWMENGQYWAQYVSSTPSTQSDVVLLAERLDQRLKSRQARTTGICPIREELYAQCFDEIIRQVTIICKERGLLLLRVRDEIRMTIAVYQTLYESSIAFGMRKALQAEQRRAEKAVKIKQLELDVAEQKEKVAQLKSMCRRSEEQAKEKRQKSIAAHHLKVAELKANNQALKATLNQELGIQRR